MQNLNVDIAYTKMTGSGNDFILIDNFDGKYDVDSIKKIVPKLCARGLSIGADGLILISPTTGLQSADFIWHFYNADGSIPAMCGNGARCAARFAYLNGRAGAKMSFITGAGVIKAEIKGAAVNTQLTKLSGLRIDSRLSVGKREYIYSFVDSGVPHVVIFRDDLESMDVVAEGAAIRHHEQFEGGANVNFAKVVGGGVRIRTYERGVENETLACGTGSVAVAAVCIAKGVASSPVKVLTTGKIDLIVSFNGDDVYLEGEARVLTSGIINKEAYSY